MAESQIDVLAAWIVANGKTTEPEWKTNSKR